jgi:uncharacterized protein YbaP (TraB family)
MMPIFTSQLISMREIGLEQEDALDLYFAKKAKSQNLKIVGLEKIEEQIRSIDEMALVRYELEVLQH